jgi:cytosine/adenosine deaminase-related metal-dependent hydrolase
LSESRTTPPATEGILLRNATVLDYFPVALDADPEPRVERTDLRLSGDRIVARGQDLAAAPGDEIIDLAGVTVMPGNVNAHDHLYATLLGGMPLPDTPLESFTDILTEIWWPLDRALDADAVRVSALAGAWDAVRCGTTLVFDHHASLSCVEGSLDLVEDALDRIGLRGCLCYEVTDRGGKGLRDVPLQENERYLQKLVDRPDGGVPRFRGLVGAHASFTLEERTLELLAGVCSRYDTGLHAHLAEGAIDREVSRDRGWKDPLERFNAYGLLRPGSVFAHGVDLSPLDMQVLDSRQAWLIHCGRSNMNNGVGRAPVDRFPGHCGVGTDGLDDNLWGELRTTFFRGNEGGRGPLSHKDAARFWLGNFQLARHVFGEPFGSLAAGAPADLLVLNSYQKTPLTTETWLNHLLFDFHPWDIREVWVGGRRAYRVGDEPPLAAQEVQDTAARLWEAMRRRA